MPDLGTNKVLLMKMKTCFSAQPAAVLSQYHSLHTDLFLVCVRIHMKTSGMLMFRSSPNERMPALNGIASSIFAMHLYKISF